MTSTLREFGDYVDLEEIGRGSFGIVYKAWHKQLDRWDAVKILQGDVLNDECVEAFLREARHAAAIHLSGCPYVASVYNCGLIDGQAFIATELVEGQTLDAWLADHRRARRLPSLDVVAPIVEGLALGLAHAHARCIAHHDIKPGNIILRAGNLTPVIVDFGSGASLGDASKLAGEITGTPRYMAPEQALGEARPFSPASDIYSLGLVMYDLFTGQPAFASHPVDELPNKNALVRGSHASAALQSHFFSMPPLPRFLRPEIPASWEQVCMRCLETDISKRTITGHDIAASLAAWRMRQRYKRATTKVWPWIAAAAISLVMALAAC